MENLTKTIVIAVLLQLLLLQFQASGPNKRGYKVCRTKECHKTANRFKNLLNFSAPPCDDFYAYACGYHNNRTGTLQTIINDLPKVLKEVLITPKIFKPKGHFQRVKSMYQACLRSGNVRKTDLIATVKTALRNIGGMPLISHTDYKPGLSWEKRLAIFLRQSKHQPVLNLELFEKQPVLAIVPSKEFFVLDIVQLIKLNKSEDVATNLWMTFQKSLICFLRGESPRCIKNKTFDEELTRILEFEMKLLKAYSMVPYAEAIGYFHMPENFLTLKKLRATFPQVHWADFFEELLRETKTSISERTTFLISGKKILNDVFQLIANCNKTMIQNYLGLFTIKMFTLASTKIFYDYLLQIPELKPIVASPFKAGSLDVPCGKHIKLIFPYSVGRIFAERYFNLDDRKEVINIIYNLKQEMAKFLQGRDWMNKDTKRSAVNKLLSMDAYVGYPPWIWNDNELQRREAVPEKNVKKSFHSNLMRAYHNKRYKRLRRFQMSHGTFNRKTLLQDRDHEIWDGGPTEFTVAYSFIINIMFASAGALISPFYNRDNLLSLNYGGLGFALAHEVTHAFDVTGIQYDEIGKERNWLGLQASAEYQKRIQCYRDLFGSIVDDVANLTLDGNKTLGENMADLGGIRRSYDAYMKQNPKDVRLPGMTNINHIQLFFISAARLFCQKDDYNTRKSAVTGDVHSPGKYRILLTLKNFKPFAEAFNCPRGSSMNPEKRCPMS